MIAGRSIADKIEALDKSNITFNVVKMFIYQLLFGFIGIVLLIMAAKQLRRLVARKENYYDDDDR